MIKAVTDIKTKVKPNKLELSVKMFAANLPYLIEHARLISKVRSLLCSKCNQGIGLLSNSPELLRKAAAYCEEHNSSN